MGFEESVKIVIWPKLEVVKTDDTHVTSELVRPFFFNQNDWVNRVGIGNTHFDTISVCINLPVQPLLGSSPVGDKVMKKTGGLLLRPFVCPVRPQI